MIQTGAITEEPHCFQTFFVPQDSYAVRQSMRAAAKYSKAEGCYEAYFLSTLQAVTAVAASLINSLAYSIRAVCLFVVHVVNLRLDLAVNALSDDLLAALQSIAFVAVGIGYVVAGLLFPQTVYPFFAPEERVLPLKIQAPATPAIPCHLVPGDATFVRQSMTYAAKMAESEDMVISRFHSALYATIAVAISIFNIATYAMRGACSFVVGIVELKFAQAFVDLGSDLFAAIRSAALGSIGFGYVAAGLLSPQPVYSFFAPPEVAAPPQGTPPITTHEAL